MALVENGSQLISISADGIMMLSSVNVLVKGIPIGYQPSVHLPTVHLMRQSDLVALDDRITELKNQVSCIIGMLSAAPVLASNFQTKAKGKANFQELTASLRSQPCTPWL